MIQRRTAHAGIKTRIGNHTFRGTGITAYLKNKMWVATGLLGTMIFAALVLAVQERHANAADPPQEALPTGRNVRLSTNVSTLAENVVLTARSSTGKDDLQSNVSSWSPTQRHDSAALIRPKMLHVRQRSSTRLRFVDVKMRLLALWHQSLARAEKSRNWPLFANSNKERRKKVSYTAERPINASERDHLWR